MAEPAYTGEYTGMENYFKNKQYKDVTPYVGVTPEMQEAYDLFKSNIGVPQGYGDAIERAKALLASGSSLSQMGIDPSKFAARAGKFMQKPTPWLEKGKQSALARNRVIGKEAWGEMAGGIGGRGTIGSTANDPQIMAAAERFSQAQTGVETTYGKLGEDIKMNRLSAVMEAGGLISDALQKEKTTGLLAEQGIAGLELQAHQQHMNDLMASYGMQWQLSQLPQEHMNNVAQWWASMGGGPTDLDALINAGATLLDIYMAGQGLPPVAREGAGGISDPE